MRTLKARLASFFLAAIAISIFAIVLSSQSGVAQDCANFWVNPQTGAQECLDSITTPPSPRPSSGGAAPASSGSGATGGSDTPASPGPVNAVTSAINTKEPPLSQRQINQSTAYQNPLPAPNLSQLSPQSEARVSGATPGFILGSDPSPSGLAPRAYGSFGVPYTHARVSTGLGTTAVGSTNPGFLSSTYPFRASGRLTYRLPDGRTTHCSASLIRRSVIVTAAHCIQRFGSGNTLFTNFTFTPATYDGSAPYGSWSWQALSRPTSWSNGTDTGSGAARNNDLAVIALNRNSSGQFIGDLVGYNSYGWNNYSFISSARTGNLATAATTTLGYPGLLDSGRIMQRVDGPSYLTTLSGANLIYQGGPLTGGASGGPWIVNFKAANPIFSGGAGAGTEANLNIVVGVTSFGASAPNLPKDNYSSQFRQNSQFPNASYGIYGGGNIGALLNSVCNFVAGGSTLAAQGFCR